MDLFQKFIVRVNQFVRKGHIYAHVSTFNSMFPLPKMPSLNFQIHIDHKKKIGKKIFDTVESFMFLLRLYVSAQNCYLRSTICNVLPMLHNSLKYMFMDLF